MTFLTKSKPKATKAEGYCVKCNVKQFFRGQKVVTKNKRNALQGPCPDCGTTITLFVKKDK